jgi:TRAP-type C4-dicarboxylate transport system permease small subunit
MVKKANNDKNLKIIRLFVDKFFKYFLTALISIVALGQFVQVITRYVLQVPVMGLEETMLYPTLWLYMLGAVNASRENSHIRANVLEIFLKRPKQLLVLAILGEFLSLVIGAWLTYWAWDFTGYSWKVWKGAYPRPNWTASPSQTGRPVHGKLIG